MTPPFPSDDARHHLSVGRNALVEMLHGLARKHGLSDPEVLDIVREAAEQAHDVRAGLCGARGFDQTKDLTSSHMTLINDAELEFALELEHFSRDVKEATETALAHLHLRYLTLLDCDSDAVPETPVGPETVCSTLSALVESQVLAPDERIRLLESWREDLIAELKRLYARLDKLFEAAGIKQRALRIITRPGPTTSPATTTSAGADLDSLRSALVAQRSGVPGNATATGAIGIDAGVVLENLRAWTLSQAREHGTDPLSLLSSDTFRLLAPDTATSVELIERIFECIAVDPALPDPVRTIVLRLRLPLIDRTLEGEDIASTAGRPLQELIDGVGAIADTLPMDAGMSHPGVRTLEGIVTELLAAGAINRASLVRAAGAVSAFLDRRNLAARTMLDGAEPLAAKAERRETARLLASRALRVLLDDVKSASVLEFLGRHWIHVLANTLYRKGDKHPDWRTNLGIANEISLLGHEGAVAAADLPARVEAALRQAANLDATALRGATDTLQRALAATDPVTSTIDQLLEAELATSVARDDDRLSMIHHRGLADTQARTEPGTMPEVGTWIDLGLPSGERLTGRVQWLGAMHNAALVCDPDEGRRAILTRRAICALAENGNYRVRSSARLFERATRAALDRL